MVRSSAGEGADGAPRKTVRFSHRSTCAGVNPRWPGERAGYERAHGRNVARGAAVESRASCARRQTSGVLGRCSSSRPSERTDDPRMGSTRAGARHDASPSRCSASPGRPCPGPGRSRRRTWRTLSTAQAASTGRRRKPGRSAAPCSPGSPTRPTGHVPKVAEAKPWRVRLQAEVPTDRARTPVPGVRGRPAMQVTTSPQRGSRGCAKERELRGPRPRGRRVFARRCFPCVAPATPRCSSWRRIAAHQERA